MSIRESISSLGKDEVSKAFNEVFYESFMAPTDSNMRVEDSLRDAYPDLSEMLEKVDMYYALVAPERNSQNRHVRTGMLLGFLVVDRLARVQPELEIQTQLQNLDRKRMDKARVEVLTGIIAQDQDMPTLPGGLTEIGDYSTKAFNTRLTTHSGAQREEVGLGFVGALYILEAGSTQGQIP